jgi:hypothetical protein
MYKPWCLGLDYNICISSFHIMGGFQGKSRVNINEGGINISMYVILSNLKRMPFDLGVNGAVRPTPVCTPTSIL